MNRTLIVARMTPGSEADVAAIFARSDATSMPRDLGVTQRALYAFHELYVHVIDFDRPPAEAMRAASAMPEFRAISDELRPHITAYAPDWASPADAMGRCFYQWATPVAAPVALPATS